jgi:hypothetical protein
MTEQPPNEPRTAEGRALLQAMLYHNSECRVFDDFDATTRAILAIEAEAAQPAKGLGGGVSSTNPFTERINVVADTPEAAQPAPLTREGLRIPLAGLLLDAWNGIVGEDDMLERLDAILAALPSAVPEPTEVGE